MCINEQSEFSCTYSYTKPPSALSFAATGRSFDVRDAKFEKGSHWVDEKTFGGRAYFQAGAQPASLVINNSTREDRGLYRCRVDFHKSPTRNARVQLRVISEYYRV